MKLHRLLLLFSIGLLSIFSVSAQDLLPHKATYKYVEGFTHVTPGILLPIIIYEEQLQLDSQVLDTAYYSVKRKRLRDHDAFPFYEFYNSFDYQLTIYDSTIYYTGEVAISYDSTIFLDRELIFNYTLQKGDTLTSFLDLYGNKKKAKIRNISRNDSLDYSLYEVGHLGEFDSRFGYRRLGLIQIDIIGIGEGLTTELISVCTDTLLYRAEKISGILVTDLVDNTNFCDSLAFRDLIDAYIAAYASGISDNPSTFQFSAFPNPFTSQLQIDTDEQMRYSIRNLQGQEIISGQANKTINTAQLAKGIYLLQLESEDGIAVKKIIKR